MILTVESHQRRITEGILFLSAALFAGWALVQGETKLWVYLFGGLAIIALYFWLFIRCAAIVTKCPKAFGALLAMGFCLNLVIQAFANIAVSLHLVPVTGLTLPLVSMGGTSMLFTCIAFGMILSVSKYIEQATREAGTVEIKTME